MATETSARLLAQDDRITSFAQLLIIPLTCQSLDDRNYAKKCVEGRTNFVNDYLYQAETVFTKLIDSEGTIKLSTLLQIFYFFNHPVLKIVF